MKIYRAHPEVITGVEIRKQGVYVNVRGQGSRPFKPILFDEREDNIRPVPHQVVGFTKIDILYWTLTALAGAGMLFALAIAVATLQKGGS